MLAGLQFFLQALGRDKDAPKEGDVGNMTVQQTGQERFFVNTSS